MPRGKSSNGNGAESGAHLPVLVDPRLVRALDHVLRQHILLAAVAGEVSPNELSKALDEGLSQVSYHVKVLRDDCDGMIEQTRTEPRRGAVEHYYRASAKTLLPAKAWRGLKKGLRAVVGAGQASDLFNDLANALQAGKLQGEHDRITRTPLVLDGEGKRNVKAIAERATKEVEDEQQATAKRMEKANGNGGKAVGYTFALLAFEAAWEPADLHALVAQVEGSAPASANGSNGARQNGGGSKGARRKARVGSK
jgi:DNA-binding transcriptional ArsR family regulator